MLDLIHSYLRGLQEQISNNTIALTSFIELEEKLLKLEQRYNEYQEIHGEIEHLAADFDVAYGKRESFEND